MNSKFVFTLFTPTYNRVHTLQRTFDSIKSQTFRDFEWLIIDDGSTDNTKELIKNWKKTVDFPIRYYYQKNSGVNVSTNKALKLACGKFFLYCYSDDSFEKNALERFYFHWQNIPENQKENFVGITCLCNDQFGNIVGDKFPKDIFDSDTLETTLKYRISGEKWGFQRVDVFRKFPFPQLDCRLPYHIPESLVWNRIAKKYKTRYINEALRIYFVGEADSICTGSKIKMFKLDGSILYLKELLNDHFEWFYVNPKYFLHKFIEYGYFSLHANKSIKKQFSELHGLGKKALFCLIFPISFSIFVFSRLIGKRNI